MLHCTTHYPLRLCFKTLELSSGLVGRVLDSGLSVSECVCVYYLTNIYGHMETGPRLRVSSDRLEEQGIKLRTRVGFDRDSPEALCCVNERDTIFCLVLVQPRKTENHPDMTEKLLTGT